MTIISEIVWLGGLSILAIQAGSQRSVEVTETNQTAYRADFIGFSGNSINLQNVQAGGAAKYLSKISCDCGSRAQKQFRQNRKHRWRSNCEAEVVFWQAT
jgi:cytochrome c oxidase assembly protein Cox11